MSNDFPMQKVKSSNLDSIGYSEDLALLRIRFRNGKLYEYQKVPKKIFNGLKNATSKGKFADKYIYHIYKGYEIKKPNSTIASKSSTTQFTPIYSNINSVYNPSSTSDKMMNKVKSNIIFIAGIHGVGKSTLCQKISLKYNLEHYSASHLIKKINSKDYSNYKLVETIDSNQDDLIIAIQNFLDKDRNYFLDGHFCLLNSEKDITKIPEEIFKNMNLRAIVVLTDDSENILKRLNGRDSSNYTIEEISKFNDSELDYSKKIADKFNIPYFQYEFKNSEEELYNFLKQVL